MDPWQVRVCPECKKLSDVVATVCSCGYVFPTPPKDSKFAAYPRFGSGSQPPSISLETHLELTTLAWHHRLWRHHWIWSFITGCFCIFSWAYTLVAYFKMRAIRSKVSAMGVNLNWWKNHYKTK